MGFPLGCSELLLPKLLLHLLHLLSLLRTLISRTLALFGLGDLVDPDSSITYPHYPNPKFKPISAVLIQEILPIVQYHELVAEAEQQQEEGERCAVCLYELEAREEVRRLSNCRHVFHRCCLDPWVELDQRTCPLCRAELVPAEGRESFERRLREVEAADDSFLLLSASQ